MTTTPTTRPLWADSSKARRVKSFTSWALEGSSTGMRAPASVQAAVGADLGRGERRVVAHHDDARGPGGRAGGVRDREPVEGDVGADALEDGHGPGAGHLPRPVHHRRALGLVVGERRLDAELGEEVRVRLADREDVGHRRAGIAGQQRDPGLERPLDDQLVAVEDGAPEPASQRRSLRRAGLPVDREGRHPELLGLLVSIATYDVRR